MEETPKLPSKEESKKFRCKWCGEIYESELGLFCPHCSRFQTNSQNPNPPEPLDES